MSGDGGWLDVRDAEPALDGEDYGYRVESRPVLATDGLCVQVALLSRYRHEDGRPGLTRDRDWHVLGPDGYRFDNVTHWQPLPKVPGFPCAACGSRVSPLEADIGHRCRDTAGLVRELRRCLAKYVTSERWWPADLAAIQAANEWLGNTELPPAAAAGGR